MPRGLVSGSILFASAVLVGAGLLVSVSLTFHHGAPWLVGGTAVLGGQVWAASERRRALLQVADVLRSPGDDAALADCPPVVEQLAALAERSRPQPVRPKTDPMFDDSALYQVPDSLKAGGSSRQRMVARLTPDLAWLAATPPLLRFLGRSAGDLDGTSFLDLVEPDDVPPLRRVLDEAIQDGEGHNFVFRMAGFASGTPATREVRHVQLDVMTAYSDKGVPLHLRCHLLDVTDKVRTERELVRRTEELSQANARLRQINHDLQRLKESYRDLYHNAPVLYFSLDVQGRFAAVNETLLRVLGYARDEVMGQPYTKVLLDEDRPAFLDDPALFQHPGEIETRWVKRDGSVIDVWIGTTTIKDAESRFVRSRSVARDMTAYRRLARAVQAKAEELAQANERLRRINQELEEFTYVVSHDLKEPLRTLEAFSNFLADDYGDVLQDEGREYLAHLIQASRRLARLIDDLLTLSRVGRFLKKPAPFWWEPLLELVAADLHELLQRKQAVLRVEGPLPPAVGDPERIGQLLTNLVSNGLKYNTSDTPEVVVGTAASATPGEVVVFVRDNGIGIAAEHHAEIFRIFRRLHHRDKFEGTGAGLAICKKIVESHGGRIWVESTPGQGATFYFTLPAAN